MPLDGETDIVDGVVVLKVVHVSEGFGGRGTFFEDDAVAVLVMEVGTVILIVRPTICHKINGQHTTA